MSTRYDGNGWDIDSDSIINYNGTEFSASGLTRGGLVYNSLGYDVNGYNEFNFNAQGIHKISGTLYSNQGNQANKDGYSRDGWNYDTGTNIVTSTLFDSDGFNVNGLDGVGLSGFDRDGWSLNADGNHKVTMTQYDSEGYNRNGINANGDLRIARPPRKLYYIFTGPDTVTLVWVKPRHPYVDQYIIRRNEDEPYATVTDIGGRVEYVISGLEEGVHTFYVKAVNSTGDSSEISFGPIDTTAPATLTGLSSTVGIRSITFNWTPPSVANTDIVEYRITASPTASEYKVYSSSSITINDIYNNTDYGFDIFYRIINIYSSVASATASFANIQIPPIPWKPFRPAVGLGGPSQIFVSWQLSRNEDIQISKYEVFCFKTPNFQVPNGITNIIDNLTVESTTDFANITLTAGVSYTFTLTAWNITQIAGEEPTNNSSVPSDPSDPIIVAIKPNPPAVVDLNVQGNSIVITWTPPVFTGYASITQYIAYDTSDNLLQQWSHDESTSQILDAQVTQVYMTALNEVGESVASALSDIIELPDNTAAPLQVAKPTIEVVGDKTLDISWMKNEADPNPVTKYTVTLYGSDDIGNNPTPNIEPISVDLDPSAPGFEGTSYAIGIENLVAGYGYYATVTAFNGAVSSEPSVASDPIIAAEPPGPPTEVELSVSGSNVIVTWTPPVNNGYSEITEYSISNTVTAAYQIVQYVEGMNYSVSLQSNLSPVTQVFIIANNDAGGGDSALSNIIVSTNIIDAPPKVGKPNASIYGGISGRTTISWTLLAENLGITKYKVLCFKTPGVPVPDGITNEIDNLTVETDGTMTYGDGTITYVYATLTAGVSYTFTVTAWDAEDNSSDPSDPSDPVIAITSPGPPTGVTLSVTEGKREITVTWIPPVFNGYKEIEVYDVYDADNTDGNYLESWVYDGQNSKVLNFQVTQVYMKAWNNMGSFSVDSALSNIIELTAIVPDFPINVVAVAGGASATITWEAPVSDGGSAITEYIVVSTPDNKSQPVPADTYTYTMTGLKPGISYTFQVFAKNAIGISGTSPAIIAL